MRKAVALPYSVDQNEPSKPLAHLVDIPENINDRNDLLKYLFTQHVCDDLHPDEIEVYNGDQDYGDIVVADLDGNMFLYLTYVS